MRPDIARAMRLGVGVAIAAAAGPGPAGASGMSPVCKFSTDPSGSIFEAKYRLADAYRAAELVVIGRPVAGTNLTLRVTRTIKGPKTGELALTPKRCQGTACEGLSLPDGEYLLLLRKEGPVWAKVDGTGNDACPNIFEVKDRTAQIAGRKVKASGLKRYFEARPGPIPFP